MIEVTNSSEFKRLIQALSLDITSAAIHYRKFKRLLTTLNENPDVEANARTFWSLTLEGALTMCLQALCRAFDQEKTGLHLVNWLRTIEANSHLFSETNFRERLKENSFVESLAAETKQPDPNVLKSDIEACSAKDPLVRTLVIHRGNRIAHRNAKNIVEEFDIDTDHPLGYSEIETLIDRAVSVLNRYSAMFDANTYSTSMIGEDDYEYVIESIKGQIQLAKARRGDQRPET